MNKQFFEERIEATIKEIEQCLNDFVELGETHQFTYDDLCLLRDLLKESLIYANNYKEVEHGLE